MEKNSLQNVLLIVVGAYLVYLAYQLFTGLSGDEGNKIVMGIAVVVFAVAGVALIIICVMRLIRSSSQRTDSASDEAASENADDSEKLQNDEADVHTVQMDGGEEILTEADTDMTGSMEESPAEAEEEMPEDTKA